ncbi:MAG TPA: phosphotransferase [Thermoplasmata archaeon]|nr:phosphotransferase [Thermoplasmata archaeon]
MTRSRIALRAVVVVLRAGDRILLLRRAAGDDEFPGYWDLPGGRVERGETYRDAADRELREESGLRARRLRAFCAVERPLDPRAGSAPRPRRASVPAFRLVGFDGTVPAPSPVVLDPTEHSAARWVGWPEVAAACRAGRVPPGTVRVLTRAAERHGRPGGIPIARGSPAGAPAASRPAGTTRPPSRRSPLPPWNELARALRPAGPNGAVRRFRLRPAGWTNLVLEADGRWIFRIPRWAATARALHREIALLEHLGPRMRIAIPEPVRIGTLARPAGWPFVVYPKLPGAPIGRLATMDRDAQLRLARFLSTALEDLERVGLAPLRALGLAPGDPASLLARLEDRERRYRRVARPRLPAAARRAIETGFDELAAAIRRATYRPTLVHNDLWPNHVLWDRSRGRPTGIIDWEDARIGDPVVDLVTFGELAPAAFDVAARRRRAADREFDTRLALYRRLLPLAGFVFGLETGNSRIAEDHRRQLARSLRVPA